MKNALKLILALSIAVSAIAQTAATFANAYASGTTYIKSALVNGPDGCAYASLQKNNVGHTPATSPTWWTPLGCGIRTSIGAMFGFGTSYMGGAGATNAAATSGFALVANDVPVTQVENHGQNGATTPSVGVQTFQFFHPAVGRPTLTLMDGGANDGSGSVSAAVTNYKNIVRAEIAYSTLTETYRTRLGNLTASGWSTDNSTLPTYVPPTSGSYAQPAIGYGLVSTGTTALTVTASTGTAALAVGITYPVVNSSSLTFTVSIDGTLQTNNCSGTTTFAVAPCGGSMSGTTFAPNRQEFTVSSAATHSIVITPSASGVSIFSVDWQAPSTDPMLGITAYLGTNANFSGQVAYDTAAASVVAEFSAKGYPVVFASQVSGNPGVNNTTDTSATATASCVAALLSGHPNDCGYDHWRQTIENALSAANIRIALYNQAGRTVANTGILNSVLRVATVANNSFSDINTGVAIPSGLNFYESPGSTPASDQSIAGVGFYRDQSSGKPWSSAYATMDYNYFGWHCHVTVPSPADTTSNSTFTTTDCVDASGKYYTPGLQVLPTTAGTCSLTIAGTFQYTQGGSGVKDIIQVCAHDSGGTYAWRTIY